MHAILWALKDGCCSKLPLFTEGIKTQTRSLSLVEICHSLQCFQAGCLRRHTLTHELYHGMGSYHLDIRFTISGGPGGSDFIIDIKTGSDNGGIPYPARHLKGEPAGGSYPGDIALGVNRQTV